MMNEIFVSSDGIVGVALIVLSVAAIAIGTLFIVAAVKRFKSIQRDEKRKLSGKKDE
jgi:hypothetical protein